MGALRGLLCDSSAVLSMLLVQFSDAWEDPGARACIRGLGEEPTAGSRGMAPGVESEDLACCPFSYNIEGSKVKNFFDSSSRVPHVSQP